MLIIYEQLDRGSAQVEISTSSRFWARELQYYTTGARLSTIQQDYMGTTSEDRPSRFVDEPLDKPPDAQHEKKIQAPTEPEGPSAWSLNNQDFVPDGNIVILAAGAVFGIIIAFFFYLRHLKSFFTIHGRMLSVARGACNRVLNLNCMLLIFYLQLRTSQLPSSCHLESSLPGSQYSTAPDSLRSTGLLSESATLIVNPTSTSPMSLPTSTPSAFVKTPETDNSATHDQETGSTPRSPCINCTDCGKSFTQRFNLNKHRKYDCQKRSTTKFACRNGCGKVFSRDAYRKQHEQGIRCRRLRNRQTSPKAAPVIKPTAEVDDTGSLEGYTVANGNSGHATPAPSEFIDIGAPFSAM
ncbi:hypothetical protein GQ53DRAFT_812923, partial [Thozetella sp. PMI_491]